MLKVILFLTVLLLVAAVAMVWFAAFIKMVAFVVPKPLLWFIVIFVLMFLYFRMLKSDVVSPAIEPACAPFQMKRKSMLLEPPNPNRPRFVTLPQKTFYSTAL